MLLGRSRRPGMEGRNTGGWLGGLAGNAMLWTQPQRCMPSRRRSCVNSPQRCPGLGPSPLGAVPPFPTPPPHTPTYHHTHTLPPLQTPARRLPGYGGKAAEAFEQHGIGAATDLQRLSQQQMEQLLGLKPAAAAQLHAWCRGLDDTPVQASGLEGAMLRSKRACAMYSRHDRGPPSSVGSPQASGWQAWALRVWGDDEHWDSPSGGLTDCRIAGIFWQDPGWVDWTLSAADMVLAHMPGRRTAALPRRCPSR